MSYRTRIYYSAKQRAEIWDRWERGESMSSIGRRFDVDLSRISSASLSHLPHFSFKVCR